MRTARSTERCTIYLHVLMCCRTLCYRPTYAIAYASPPPPWPKSRANTAPLYTVSRANLILPGTSKASTAPLLIVHEDPTNTGGCDHVVPVKENQTVSTQAKLHTCIIAHAPSCAIFQPVQEVTARSHLAQHVGPCTRQYASRLYIFPVFVLLLLLVLMFEHFLLGEWLY